MDVAGIITLGAIAASNCQYHGRDSIVPDTYSISVFFTAAVELVTIFKLLLDYYGNLCALVTVVEKATGNYNFQIAADGVLSILFSAKYLRNRQASTLLK
ncbi:hypothetical protein A6770_26765 [Nostoc minutum NIES-26]|uniref:Uncharacterized protein n=1 Tax=Nostoc minutum NIES-26 TaxID=1844469 RepID=A0A367QPL5_9NOSO|nr:hypothetical protein A6770_26765 [Nostoc minutum NIES-26]